MTSGTLQIGQSISTCCVTEVSSLAPGDAEMTGLEKMGRGGDWGARPGPVRLGGDGASTALQLGDAVFDFEAKPFECLHLVLPSSIPTIVDQAVQTPMFMLQTIKIAIHVHPPCPGRSVKGLNHSN
jgi:hypothetical protein